MARRATLPNFPKIQSLVSDCGITVRYSVGHYPTFGRKKRRKEMFYLTTQLTHFIYGYMVIAREESS